MVERYQQIRDFKSEKYWQIKMVITKQTPKGKEAARFEWVRHRVFDKLVCLVFFEKCLDAGKAVVQSV